MPSLFGFQERFSGAVGPDEQLRIVLETDAVHLPEIEMIGAEATEGFAQHLEAEPGFAPVRADLGHEEDAVAEAGETLAHQRLGLAATVFPAVIEESDARVNGLMHKADGGLLVGRVAEVVAAEAERGDGDVVVAAEGPLRDRLLHHGTAPCKVGTGEQTNSLRLVSALTLLP